MASVVVGADRSGSLVGGAVAVATSTVAKAVAAAANEAINHEVLIC
jgi:hypothetical protein